MNSYPTFQLLEQAPWKSNPKYTPPASACTLQLSLMIVSPLSIRPSSWGFLGFYLIAWKAGKELGIILGNIHVTLHG